MITSTNRLTPSPRIAKASGSTSLILSQASRVSLALAVTLTFLLLLFFFFLPPVALIDVLPPAFSQPSREMESQVGCSLSGLDR